MDHLREELLEAQLQRANADALRVHNVPWSCLEELAFVCIALLCGELELILAAVTHNPVAKSELDSLSIDKIDNVLLTALVDKVRLS